MNNLEFTVRNIWVSLEAMKSVAISVTISFSSWTLTQTFRVTYVKHILPHVVAHISLFFDQFRSASRVSHSVPSNTKNSRACDSLKCTYHLTVHNRTVCCRTLYERNV